MIHFQKLIATLIDFFFAAVNPAVETRFDYVDLKISSSLTENQICSCKLSCKVYNA